MFNFMLNTAKTPYLHGPLLFWLLMVSIFSSALTLADDNWEFLGTVRASKCADKAMFRLDGSQAFSKIRFQASGGDIRLIKTKIHFGQKQLIMEGLQKLIRVNEYSRTIPLSNPKQQAIGQVEIFYKVINQTIPSREASISLMGVPAH